uniref:Uncharacterized protein n=1 Tax=Ciona savignyi TaxID=51511 RepID=H2YDQ4_CIOSA
SSLTVVLCTEKSEAATAKRPFRGQGGWTLNSVGYNAGLGALRKLFEKRDSSTADLDDEAIPLNNRELDNLAQDFIRFIEIRGIRSIEIRQSTDLVLSLFYHVLLRVQKSKG